MSAMLIEMSMGLGIGIGMGIGTIGGMGRNGQWEEIGWEFQ